MLFEPCFVYEWDGSQRYGYSRTTTNTGVVEQGKNCGQKLKGFLQFAVLNLPNVWLRFLPCSRQKMLHNVTPLFAQRALILPKNRYRYTRMVGVVWGQEPLWNPCLTRLLLCAAFISLCVVQYCSTTAEFSEFVCWSNVEVLVHEICVPCQNKNCKFHHNHTCQSHQFPTARWENSVQLFIGANHIWAQGV